MRFGLFTAKGPGHKKLKKKQPNIDVFYRHAPALCRVLEILWFR